MALKNRYNYNRQTIAFSQIGRLQALGYMEVLPGETLNGRVTVDAFSAPTVRNIQTRVYSDTYAFFVPYRLLWDRWTDYISQNATDQEIPLVDTLFPENFESRFTIATDGTIADRNTAWQRRAYNMVFVKFFRGEDNWDERVASGTEDNLAWSVCSQRPSTWEVAEPPKDIPSQPIPAGTIDDLRSAFAQDQWDKMRQYYGSRYVDYMRALGVNTPWTLREEPELLGKKSGDWGYKMVSNMTDTATGGDFASNAGFFHNKQIVDMRRKFIPEHGLVVLMHVTRADPFFGVPPMEVHNCKVNLDQYWSPEFEAQREYNYPNSLIGGGDVEFNIPRIPFDEYRRGMNTNAGLDSFQNEQVMGMAIETGAQRVITPASYDSEFVPNYFPVASVGGGEYHYQSTSEWRISRSSPLIRQGQSKAIH